MSERSGAFSPERLDRLAAIMRGYVERGEVAGVVSVLCRHHEVHVASRPGAGGWCRRPTTISRSPA